jgi:aminobenzoyl-glutamate utilization protein B
MRPRLHFIAMVLVLFYAATAGGTADKKEADDSITPPPAEWSPAKKTAVAWVDAQKDMLVHISDELWKYAEPGMLEYRSAKLLEGTLEEFGFTVERGVAGMPTAFTARYGTGKPVIGILAEYDALGGLSQKASPERSPIIKGGPGHGCGHNIFGAGSVGAAIAVAQAIKEGQAKGTVILYGTPNEEGVVGKAFMARDGLYDELDACLHWHPGGKNRVGTGEGGNDLTSFMVAFYGRTAHSGGAPWKGHSALDAVELMGVMTNYFREHLHPSYRIHYVILEGGRAPNVVPDYAKAWFYLRGGTREMVDMMYDRMQKIAEAAALATNTEKKIRLYTSINHTRNNTEGAKVMHSNLQLIGAPKFTEEEQAFARKLQKALEAEEKGLSSEIEPLKPPTERDLDNFIGSGSSDVAEASLIAPTVGLSVATSALELPGHHWTTVACSGSSIGHKGLIVATKVLASTALDIMLKPDTLAAMQTEFDEMMDGKKYVSSIPADVEPAILPNPYENPDWEPGDLDYPAWFSFSWNKEEEKPKK